MSLAVANHFAIALLDSASRPGIGIEPEAVLGQVESFAAALKSSTELRTVMLSPAVAFTQKRKLMTRLGAEMGLHSLISDFLLVVTRHRRLPMLAAIAQRIEALLDERHGVVRAHVSSAQPLDEERRKSLEAAIARKTGKQVRCAFESDPALLGGVSVRVGSSVLDGSVKGQLESLRRHLSSVK
jgi:F-type H+-transporting ATPase subunit delta